MQNVLNKKVQSWLTTERAKQLADGSNCRYEEFELLRSLCFKYAGTSAVNPLSSASRKRLVRLIADPMQQVEDSEMAALAQEIGEPDSGLVWVDASAMDGTLIYHKELNPCGLSCHGNHPHVSVLSYQDGSFVVSGQARAAGIHVSGGEFHDEFADRKSAIVHAKKMVA